MSVRSVSLIQVYAKRDAGEASLFYFGCLLGVSRSC